MQTPTPISLRKLYNSSLELELSVSAISHTYSSADFPNGNWLIDLDLAAGQTYEADLRWFSAGHLVLYEFGSFTTDDAQQTVSLDLDFADEGLGGFDDDCGGDSNLVELTAGDPAETAGIRDCGMNESLNDPQAIYLLRNYKSFRNSGYFERVNRYEKNANTSIQPKS